METSKKRYTRWRFSLAARRRKHESDLGYWLDGKARRDYFRGARSLRPFCHKHQFGTRNPSQVDYQNAESCTNLLRVLLSLPALSIEPRSLSFFSTVPSSKVRRQQRTV